MLQAFHVRCVAVVLWLRRRFTIAVPRLWYATPLGRTYSHLSVHVDAHSYFVLEFNMVKPKELEPLSRLITKIKEMAKAPHLEHK